MADKRFQVNTATRFLIYSLASIDITMVMHGATTYTFPFSLLRSKFDVAYRYYNYSNMKPRITNIVLVAACFWMAVGCGTIIHGSSQVISVSSWPDGAGAWINGARMGTTPARLTLKRKNDVTIHLVKEGFKPIDVRIESSISDWMFGNIFIPGCLVDLSTGGAYELSPERVDVNMIKISTLDIPIRVPAKYAETIRKIRLHDDTGKELGSIVIDWE